MMEFGDAERIPMVVRKILNVLQKNKNKEHYLKKGAKVLRHHLATRECVKSEQSGGKSTLQ